MEMQLLHKRFVDPGVPSGELGAAVGAVPGLKLGLVVSQAFLPAIACVGFLHDRFMIKVHDLPRLLLSSHPGQVWRRLAEHMQQSKISDISH